MAPVLPFTDNPEANRLLGEDPLALLIGFALDQQVTVQHAFNGPWELRRRIGHLDPSRIATMDLGELERVFRERPALHRYPASMAGRVAALCRSSRTPTTATPAESGASEPSDGADLEQRCARCIERRTEGERAARHLSSTFGVQLPGLAERCRPAPTLGPTWTRRGPSSATRSRSRAYKAALGRPVGKAVAPPRAEHGAALERRPDVGTRRPPQPSYHPGGPVVVLSHRLTRPLTRLSRAARCPSGSSGRSTAVMAMPAVETR